MVVAAIDIGTNTMLMLVAEIEPLSTASASGIKRKIGKILEDHIDFVRLGEGVHQNRSFSPEAMERARQCFFKYKDICDRHQIEQTIAVATSASRDSSNAKIFYDQIFREIGIKVEIIDGKTEAKLSFLGGLLPNQDPKKHALLDIGGGSTEFVALDATGRNVHGQSLDMGCVRAMEVFLKGDPYSKASLEAMEAHFRERWKEIDPKIQAELREKEWVGIAGTPTTLAALAQNLYTFTSARIDGFRLDRCNIADLYESLAIQTCVQREALPLVGRGRADIIVSGTAILLTAMEVFGKDDVIVSSRGLRHGILTAF